MLTKRRRSFTGFSLLALALIGFSAHLLLKTEIQRWEARFAQQVHSVASRVRNQLDTNEAVLAGFSAFLQAVEESDTEAAARYAESVVAAYPHIYMLEVASRVARAEQEGFAELLRRTWRADFQLKEFPAQAAQPAPARLPLSETWPLLFMYPALPEARAVYGVRLETVGYLAYALQQARKNARPVVSPVFAMLEGGDAYMLLRSVDRPEPSQQTAARPNFFGNNMVALLLIKTERSAYLATHDALTALPNRHLLAARFGEACAYYQRHGTPFALMIVDLDHFKEINDQLGHEIGDQVLQAVALRMQQASRPYDTVARYGGDEFIILLRDIAQAEHAKTAGQAMLQAVNAPIPTDAGEQSVSCSIGIALYPADGATFDELLSAADQAMYRVKQGGRHGVALSGELG